MVVLVVELMVELMAELLVELETHLPMVPVLSPAKPEPCAKVLRATGRRVV
jgi:hypothetical protein